MKAKLLNVTVGNIRKKDWKKTDTETIEFYEMYQKGDFIDPKHKLSKSCFEKMVSEDIKRDDVLNLICELKFITRENKQFFVVDRIVDFERV